MGLVTWNERIKYKQRTDPVYAAKFAFWSMMFLGLITGIIFGVKSKPVSDLEYACILVPLVLAASLFAAGISYLSAREYQGASKVYQEQGFGEKTARREALADLRARGRRQNQGAFGIIAGIPGLFIQ